MLGNLRFVAAANLAAIRSLGLIGWLLYLTGEMSPRLAGLLRHRQWPKNSRHSLKYRPAGSDMDVFRQTFVDPGYGYLKGMSIEGLIIDCGANVGFTSALFLTIFPRAHLIAIEPDRNNFALLEANTARFGSRVDCVNSAVWSHRCGLVFTGERYRDGRSWAIQLRPALPNETPDVVATDIETIRERSGFERIALLKVDVERAELEIFANGRTDWIALCDNILIELHDEECERVFYSAIAGEGFHVSRCGELTVCVRPGSLDAGS